MQEIDTVLREFMDRKALFTSIDIANEVKRDRLGDSLQPNLPAYTALHAIINLAANHALMNAPGHAPIAPQASSHFK